MNFTDQQLTQWITGFLWPLFRVGALIMVAPILGVRVVPMRFRVGIALALTLVIVPLLPPGPQVDPVSAHGILISGAQILTGLAMGFLMRLVFSAVEMGGNLIGQTMGLGFAQMMDPANGVTVPVVSQFYIVLATLTFLALNGHLILIEALVDSFRAIPVALEPISGNGLWVMLEWSGWIFKGALVISLPALASLLLVNAAFGVMMRAAPQLNIFVIGFPISLMLGFIFILLSLPLFVPQFTSMTESAFDALHSMMAE
ncbi:MAG: flagellar biosynthetic protein FliR [Gammaproteobacteria bacterium]|nr:flagellar biosynthetic protein FliR [Gammaproteobacteria bacterium]